jgi:hypothetical protein
MIYFLSIYFFLSNSALKKISPSGFSVALLAEVPYRGIFFGAYNTLKQVVQPNVSFFERWTVAQIAVAVATIVTYPLDTIKRSDEMT